MINLPEFSNNSSVSNDSLRCVNTVIKESTILAFPLNLKNVLR